jgi:hypothetical protein
MLRELEMDGGDYSDAMTEHICSFRALQSLLLTYDCDGARTLRRSLNAICQKLHDAELRHIVIALESLHNSGRYVPHRCEPHPAGADLEDLAYTARCATVRSEAIVTCSQKFSSILIEIDDTPRQN